TLRPAFDDGSRQELLRQIAQEEPARPRRLNRAIPRDLETIVLKAMAKEPAERYATAQELADDLRPFLEDKAIRAKPPSLERRRRGGRRRRSSWPTPRAASGRKSRSGRSGRRWRSGCGSGGGGTRPS